jgi:hypothetical protein
MMDLEAVVQCIGERNKLIELRQKISARQRSNEQRLNTLATGKTSFRNMFKSKSSKENEADTLKVLIEKDVQEQANYQKVINIINQYIAEKAIPFFKKDKLSNYYGMLDMLCSHEIANNGVTTSYWTMVQGQVAYSKY